MSDFDKLPPIGRYQEDEFGVAQKQFLWCHPNFVDNISSVIMAPGCEWSHYGNKVTQGFRDTEENRKANRVGLKRIWILTNTYAAEDGHRLAVWPD